jgi:hypothetical protein
MPSRLIAGARIARIRAVALLKSLTSRLLWPPLRPLLLVLAVLGAAGIGAAAAYWRSGATAFGRSNNYVAWVALVALFMMLAAIVAIVGWPSFRRLARTAGRANTAISVGVYVFVFVTAIAASVLMTGSLAIPVPGFHWRVIAILVLVAVMSGGCFCGLILLSAVMRQRGSATMRPDSRDAITELIAARSDIARLLSASAALLTAVIVVAAGMAGALNSYANTSGATEPDISVTGLLLYGAFFAILLVLLSAPGYLAWQSEARKLRDRLNPIPSHGRLSPYWYESRANLESLLQIEFGTGQRFAAVLGILAPVAVSILGAFIPEIRS